MELTGLNTFFVMMLFSLVVHGRTIAEQYTTSKRDGSSNNDGQVKRFTRQPGDYIRSYDGSSDKSDISTSSGFGQITNGYASLVQSYGQNRQIPIYEEHQGDNISANEHNGGTEYHKDGTIGVDGNSQQHHHSIGALGFQANIGGGDSPTYNAASAFVHHSNPARTTESDKISQSYFLHHNDFSPSHEFSPSLSSLHGQQFHSHDDGEEYHHQHDEHTIGNYNGHADSDFEGAGGHFQHPSSHHQQADVINYVPYPVVKKVHVPVHTPVQIPISHAVVVPIRKPVPIHIPVTQQVQVPVEKELKIPVERLVPFPVEKQVPIPVEKRVPYQVVKYVPVKVPKPYAVKVPVIKTVLHKVKGWW